MQTIIKNDILHMVILVNKEDKMDYAFNKMFDNIKYAKRLIYIKYLDSFDKKE